MKRKPSYTHKKLMKKIPKEYNLETNVFFKQDTDILLDHRNENHEIKLLEGNQVPFVWNYKSLSEQETDAIKKYIDKHFEKNFIRPSLSVAAAPVLLVKKPGGKLKFCVDYRALNAITIKNRYPILLINEMLDKLSNARQFIKLNIIYAFNKICIKKNQKWLSTFKI